MRGYLSSGCATTGLLAPAAAGTTTLDDASNRGPRPRKKLRDQDTHCSTNVKALKAARRDSRRRLSYRAFHRANMDGCEPR